MKSIAIFFIIAFATTALAGEINLENPTSPYYNVIMYESMVKVLGLSIDEVQQHNQAVKERRKANSQAPIEQREGTEKSIEGNIIELMKDRTETGRFQAASSAKGDGILILDTRLGHVWTFIWQNKQIEYHGQIIPSR